MVGTEKRPVLGGELHRLELGGVPGALSRGRATELVALVVCSNRKSEREALACTSFGLSHCCFAHLEDIEPG